LADINLFFSSSTLELIYYLNAATTGRIGMNACPEFLYYSFAPYKILLFHIRDEHISIDFII